MTKFYTDKQQIIDWLDEYKIKNYTLLPDEQYGFIVNVTGYVNLSDKKFLSIPIKFSEVTGSFNCNNNKLTSLEFSPQTVDSFYCNDNRLTSLEFSPQRIGGEFDCSYNKLTSLEFSPKTIDGDFDCNHNKLIFLEFCPETVSGSFYCNHNPKLKGIQKITDFKLIYLENKKILATNLSDKLENDLTNEDSKKTTKIKI